MASYRTLDQISNLAINVNNFSARAYRGHVFGNSLVVIQVPGGIECNEFLRRFGLCHKSTPSSVASFTARRMSRF